VALLREIDLQLKASYESSPPCVRWVIRDICMWLGVGWENSHMIVWESSRDTDSQYIHIHIHIHIHIYMWKGYRVSYKGYLYVTMCRVRELSHDRVRIITRHRFIHQYIHIHIWKGYQLSYQGYLYVTVCRVWEHSHDRVRIITRHMKSRMIIRDTIHYNHEGYPL